MVRLVVLAIAIVVSACGGSTASTNPAGGGVGTSAGATSAGATLCTALLDLADAQINHVGPLASLLSDGLAAGTWGAQSVTDIKAHIDAVGRVAAKHLNEVASLKSADLAPVIAAAQKAYSAYGQGALKLDAWAATLPGGSSDTDDFDGGTNGMAAGQPFLQDALDQIVTLNAAGAVACKVPGS